MSSSGSTLLPHLQLCRSLNDPQFGGWCQHTTPTNKNKNQSVVNSATSHYLLWLLCHQMQKHPLHLVGQTVHIDMNETCQPCLMYLDAKIAACPYHVIVTGCKLWTSCSLWLTCGHFGWVIDVHQVSCNNSPPRTHAHTHSFKYHTHKFL